MCVEALQAGQIGPALAVLVAYPYGFPAIYFGWSYGGHIWTRMFNWFDRVFEHQSGLTYLFAMGIFLGIRFYGAFIIGLFGGGIVDFLRYRRLVTLHQTLTPTESPAAAPPPLDAVPSVGVSPLRTPAGRPKPRFLVAAIPVAAVVIIGAGWLLVRRQAPSQPQVPVRLRQAFVDGKAAYTDGTETGGACRMLLQIPYDFGGEFHEGLARVANSRKFSGYAEHMLHHFGFINSAGAVVIPLQFDAAEDFHEGLAVFGVREDKGKIGVILSRFGYIDRTGKVAISPRFERAFPFSEAVALVRTGNVWGYIDQRGKILFTVSGRSATSFSEGLAAVQSGNAWGYVDRAGHFAIPATFQFASDFHGGLAPVEVGDKWGVADKGGRLVAPAQFDQLEAFAEGLAKFTTMTRLGVGPSLDLKYGFIDRSGVKVIAAVYDEAQDFSEGLSAVQKNRKWGFVDKAGTVVVPLQFDGATSFSDGVAEVARDGRWFYIDRVGKQLCLSGRRWGGDE
jgi:hypothetical protein